MWTLEGNTFTAHPVKIGISNGTLTEILSGITENMPVVTEAVVNSNAPQMEGVGENGERIFTVFLQVLRQVGNTV